MYRLQLSALLISATALLLLTPSQQASAYDGHFDYRNIESPCRAGDYYYVPRYRIPVNRYGCGYRDNRNYLPQRGQFRARDHFTPGYRSAVPAPRRDYGYQQPNFQQPYRQPYPQNSPPDRQIDPFEKYAPRQSKPQENNSPPGLPTMELPPPIPENLKKEAPPANHSHSHDHGTSEPANPSTNSDQNKENNSPFMQPTLPRISPPAARFLIPSGS